MNKIDKGLQGDAKYQKSKLYPFQFKGRRILKLVFFVPMLKLVTPLWGQFWLQRNHMNKIDKAPQRDAKYQILVVSEKKNFEVGFLCSYVATCDPQGGANFDPTSIIWTNLVQVHKETLNTKYQSSMPSSSEEKNFENGILCPYVPTCDPKGGDNLDPRSII